MQIETASIQECCDYLAECKGWSKTKSLIFRGELWEHQIYGGICTHPVPERLDSIAGSMPEGWQLARVECFNYPCGEGVWYRCILANYQRLENVDAYGDTELLARARAACLAWQRVKGEATGDTQRC